MAMNNDDQLEQTDEVGEAEFVSKTQLKNEAKSFQLFARELVNLSQDKLSVLPLNETTMTAINDFEKQSGNIAKKRHLGYIGKCLRTEDVAEIKQIIEQDQFAQRRQMLHPSKPVEQSKTEALLMALMDKGDQQIQQLVEQYPQVNRQTLRQLVRNCRQSKTDAKRAQASQKLTRFIDANHLELNKGE